MKILVLGGAGYIGSHIVLDLLRDGNEVVVFDNLSTGFKHLVDKNAKLYIGDITVSKELEEMFKKECNIKTFDCVMHFAAKLIVNESVTDPLSYYHNNVGGVRTLLSVMNKYNIKNIIFSSTAAVYGDKNGICKETDELKPINPYGASKLACEDLIKFSSKAYGINYGIFRYFNVAGADSTLKVGYEKETPSHLVPIIAEVINKVRPKLNIYGNNYDTMDGTCIRDYIHVSDLSKAHIMGAKYLISNNKSFTVNLGSGIGYSVLEIVNEAKKISDFEYEYLEKRDRDPSILIASIDDALNLLKFTPEKTLEDIIKSDIEYNKIIKNRG